MHVQVRHRLAAPKTKNGGGNGEPKEGVGGGREEKGRGKNQRGKKKSHEPKK